MFYDHKLYISKIADEFLNSKGWTATRILFNHSLWQGAYDFTDKTNDPELLNSVNTVKDIISRDPQTLSLLQPYIENVSPGDSIPIKLDQPQFESGDLYYSIQHADISGTVTKYPNGQWQAIINICDTYDFTKLRNPFTFSGLAYDMGKVLQMIGSMSVYDINISVTIAGE